VSQRLYVSKVLVFIAGSPPPGSWSAHKSSFWPAVIMWMLRHCLTAMATSLSRGRAVTNKIRSLVAVATVPCLVVSGRTNLRKLWVVCPRTATAAPWCFTNQHIHGDKEVPFTADHIRALTNSFASKLGDEGKPWFGNLKGARAGQRLTTVPLGLSRKRMEISKPLSLSTRGTA
jgi:hypothetical protein